VLVPIRASDRFLGLIAGALTMETIAQSVISPLLDVNLPFQLRDQRGALLWGRNQERLAGVETTTLPVTIGSNRWSLHIPATAIMGYSQIRLYDWLAIPFDWLTLVIGGAIIMVVTLGTSLLNRQGRLLEDKNQQIAQLNQAIQTHADQLEEEVARRTAELRKREQELRESYEQLKQAQAQLLQHERLSTIGRMSAVIAHELRNPLAALCTAAEELTHAVQLSGDHQILLDIISSQSLRLNQIINDTLSFTKPVLLEKTPTDVHQTIDRVIASLESEGRSRTRVTISKRYDASVPPLLTDQYRMEQVLWNILLNAVQSLPESRGTVQVGTTWHASGIDGVTSPCVEISVTDSGSGIPADHLDRIFEPFHTTKSRGTGLGLAIARRIVEAHGGRIRVDTEVNRGTTISVLLPSVTPEDADVHRAPLRF
jgi:signal transduction histidine kinase